MRLILASASPRRRELLASLGLSFEVAAGAALDEQSLLTGPSNSLTQRLTALAIAKGEGVARTNPGALVLSADTEVILDGHPLGKPAGREQAVAMLAKLSGRTHEVVTAVALTCHDIGMRLSGEERTAVHFARLNAQQIESYVRQAQPFDYAGGYAIQGLGAVLITGIEGDYSNVVGLPLRLTAGLLEQAGLAIL